MLKPLNSLRPSSLKLIASIVIKLVTKFAAILVATCLVTQLVNAQTNIKIETLNWMDEKYLERQRKSIDALARSEYGRPLRIDDSDKAVLQRIIDDQLIRRQDKAQLQAMGVALGDLYVKEFDLAWVIYHDATARSRAVCIPDTQQCLFPITMLSRRIEAGARPSVERVYEKGVRAIKAILPHKPYSKLRQ